MRSWWQTYKHGVYILLDDSEIVGAFGMYPIRKTPFGQLLEGLKKERDIGARSIQPLSGVRGLNDWYITGILLNKTFRRTPAIRLLISRVLDLWLADAQGKTSSRVRVCTYAFSRNGENLLKKFGFRKYKDNKTVEGRPVYLLEVSNLSELCQLCTRLAKHDC